MRLEINIDEIVQRLNQIVNTQAELLDRIDRLERYCQLNWQSATITG